MDSRSFTKTFHHKSYAAIEGHSVDGKVVYITGGARGIGRGSTEAFARSGAKAIAITGRTSSSLEETKAEIEKAFPKVQIRTFVCDIADAAAVGKSFQSLKSEFGSVDIVIANAAVLTPTGPVEKEDQAKAIEGIATNVGGAINLFTSFTAVRPKDGGIFINVSAAVVHINLPGSQAYSAAKSAIMRWIDVVKPEFKGLKVVHIHPGVVESAMTKTAGREGEDEPALPGNFEVWLTTPESSFLDGKFVWVNWDVEELIARKEEIVKNNLVELQLTGW